MQQEFKTGILTFHRANNYGSVLQAYALLKTIEQLGFNCEIIDFRMSRQEKIYETLFVPCSNLRNLARNIFTVLHLFSIKRAEREFCRFRQTFFKTSVLCKDSIPTEISNEYKCLVMGGDQIWNTTLDDFDKTFVGGFIEDKARCVSYAPSIGMESLSEQDSLVLKEIQGFSAVSVREWEGKQLLGKFISNDITVVCDPVFLLPVSQWQSLADTGESSSGIFMYLIGDTEGARKVAERIHANSGMTIYSYFKSLRDLKGHVKTRYEISPIEFLANIKNADYVITNSFHATAFSIIFQKNFWVFLQRNGSKRPQTRILNLLRQVGLTERIRYNDESIEDFDYNKEIDYLAVQPLIEQWAIESRNWLYNSIKKVYTMDEPIDNLM